MTMRKISFMVPTGLWCSFKKQSDNLFLARAPFLDHVISRELPHVRADLGPRRLSLRAKRHISGELKKQGAKSVNIAVREETALELSKVVDDHNLVRDALMCRLIIFLRSSDALLKFLEVPTVINGRHGTLQMMAMSPMKAMEELRDDPLYYVRHYVRENSECGIYDVALPQAYDWAACWIDDKDVQGTKAHREDKKMLAAMFEAAEIETFAKKNPNKKRGLK
jgi:hypothetical protein